MRPLLTKYFSYAMKGGDLKRRAVADFWKIEPSRGKREGGVASSKAETDAFEPEEDLVALQ